MEENMKYSDKNPPLVCMQTQSTCYKSTGKMQIKGILWHDTGANNPNLKRYIQPSDDAPDREEWLEKLGKNAYKNDWNHVYRKCGMNCWIGKLADGTVTTVQTMPWDFQPWGCGSGKKGSCNNGWIQFEICEDGKNDPEYLAQVYEEACEITAYLCRLFNIDPLGTADCNGVTVPTILCHQDSYKLGLGSNHSDIYDWFPKYEKSMETARADVQRLLHEETSLPDPVQLDAKEIWDVLFSFIRNSYGVAGLMGNLYAESSLKSTNLQNTGNNTLGMTDEEYTAAVDQGKYTGFAHDGYGYGLAQWTYPARKEALLSFTRQEGVSVGDCNLQLQFIREELGDALLSTLKRASSVREASDAVLFQYERPADQSEAAQDKRAEYGQRFFEQYGAPVYYRVRKTWEDKASQLGAFHELQNAKACADANPGYAVFNESGERVYPEADQEQQETGQSVIWVMIKASAENVIIRTGNGTEYSPITTAAPGTRLEYVASAFNGWHAVKTGDQVGWVSGEYRDITIE